MKEKEKYIKMILITLLFLIFQGSIIYLLDPYLRYRKPFYNKVVGVSGSPALYPGVLRNYEYDSVVLGTSMAQNFKVKELNKYLNGQFINVSQSGATIQESYDIYKVAKEKEIKMVLMSLDIYSFQNVARESNTGKYAYLFKKTFSLQEYKYLFNIDSWVQLIRILIKKSDNPYNLGYWGNPNIEYGEKVVLKNNVKIRTEKKLDFKEMQLNYEKYLKKMIEEAPETTFYFFYPPYSIIEYKALGVDFINYLKFKDFLSENLIKYANVKLLDYQDEDRIIKNLSFYKDYTHYSPEINTYILDNLDNEKYILENNNYKEKIYSLEKQVKEYIIEREK